MAPIATADQQQSKELAKQNNNIINNKRMTEKQETGYLFPSKFERDVEYRKFIFYFIYLSCVVFCVSI